MGHNLKGLVMVIVGGFIGLVMIGILHAQQAGSPSDLDSRVSPLLREYAASYKALFMPEKVAIGPKNAYFWEINNK